jgi:uncharacterized protein YyaL (SSP411 family)
MANRLADQTSPYLRQHAHNPVEWHPWGEEALALARRLDRPILLSVGYAACHWCHVMAHESFDDADTAARMNAHFVNIKVDREERPDIDQIYQTAHQLIARRPGGWPLTMFLTPDGKPFFGGTYFPKGTRYGLPGFDDLLERVSQVWRERHDEVLAQGDALAAALARTQTTGESGEPLEHAAAVAGVRLREAALRTLDELHGGFGGAPKFPQPPLLSALLRHGVAAHDDAARDAVLLTLRRMAEGGLYDQLGGGFFRYSVDAQWQIPHFEKMLYDNAQLLPLYVHAWQVEAEPLFERVVDDTVAWLQREMTGEGGAFCSSLDADSEGEEGRFYLWQREEVRAALPADEYAVFAARFGLDGEPNFERRAWHLRVGRPLAEAATLGGVEPDEAQALLASAIERLRAHREARVRPARDDKLLTSWNALAIRALALAARVFDRADWHAAARDALSAVRKTLWRDDRLLATRNEGRSHLNAYLDDHAFLLHALLECMQAGRLDADDLRFACLLADRLLDAFEDRDDGGFFFTSHDHEALVLRPQAGHDNATPSGNAVAALALQRLGHLVGESRYLDAARRTLDRFAADAMTAPTAFATLASAFAEYATPPTIVVLTGAADTWRSELDLRWRPGVIVVQLPADAEALPAALAKPAEDVAQAWVCRGPQCLPPVQSLDELEALLE